MTNGFVDSQEVSLRLTVVSYKARSPEEATTCVFTQEGGSIGRSESNRYVLADSGVSRIHARVVCRDGNFLLIDRSTNGTFVNDAVDRLAEGEEYQIRDGDRFSMGDFVIEARLERPMLTEDAFPPVSPPTRVVPMVDFESPQPAKGRVSLAPETDDLPEIDGSFADAVRPPPWFPVDDEPEPEFDSDSRAVKQAVEERPPPPVIEQHMPPPGGSAPKIPPEPGGGEGRRSPSAVPTGYVPFADQFEGYVDRQLVPDRQPTEESLPPEEPQEAITVDVGQATQAPPMAGTDKTAAPSKAPVAPAASPQAAERSPEGSPVAAGSQVGDGAEPLRAFLDGLGVPNLPIPEDQASVVLHEFGQLTREVILGLIETLRLRAEFKREFYVPGTSIGPVENNVFKYSVGVEDAISRMFSGSAEAYLGPAESARQSFQDIAAHQLATVAGMQAAVASLLEKFSPEQLSDRLGKGSMFDGVLPQYRKSRMWEQFEKEYAEIAEHAQEDFHRMFGQCFSQAYTRQVVSLQASGLGGGKKSKK